MLVIYWIIQKAGTKFNWKHCLLDDAISIGIYWQVKFLPPTKLLGYEEKICSKLLLRAGTNATILLKTNQQKTENVLFLHTMISDLYPINSNSYR